MSEPHILNVRMCGPRESHIAHIEPETRTSARTLPAHDVLKALSNKVLSRTSARTLAAHRDFGDRTLPAHRPDLPARVRLHFIEACKRLRIDPKPVLHQFDRWRYTEADLIEMDAWPTSTVIQHCLLLRDEIAAGMKP